MKHAFDDSQTRGDVIYCLLYGKKGYCIQDKPLGFEFGSFPGLGIHSIVLSFDGKQLH